MENWIQLDSESYRIVWDKFYNDFQFNPRGVKENSPYLRITQPI